MQFSERTGWEPGVNAWAEAVEAAQRRRAIPYDLTVSNPTACGLGLPDDLLLPPLSSPGATRYVPEPLGMLHARVAVADYYADHGVAVPVEQICLTTSTSEAYSFLFRLLCNPGDDVLIARPSYPLFDLLARLDDVVLREYALFYEPGSRGGSQGEWSVDFASLASATGERTRAVIVVHPNNPTGHHVSEAERAQLVTFCAERGLALIVDEVFLDYSLGQGAGGTRQRSFASNTDCLCFVLSGISKVCALPQMKASWIAASGPGFVVGEAMRRIEIIADTFLSMNGPVQFALPAWLRAREQVQGPVRQRLTQNLAALDERLRGSLGERLACEGGWTAVLRVPRFVEGEAFADAALARGVLVQPGSFYGLPHGRVVVSLLTDPATWQAGLDALPL